MTKLWEGLPRVGGSLGGYLNQDYGDSYRNIWEPVVDFAGSAPATVEQYLTTVESLLALGLDDADLKRAMSDLSFEMEPDRFGYTNSGWLAATVRVIRAVAHPA